MTNEAFQKRLRVLMDEKGETTYSIADVVGLSAPTISRYLSGKMQPKRSAILILAQHFNVNPTWLLGTDIERGTYNEGADSDKPRIVIENYKTEPLNDKTLFDSIVNLFNDGEELTNDLKEEIKFAIELTIARRKNQ